MIKPEELPAKQTGLYVAATNTFYTIMTTEFTKEAQIISRLRPMLVVKDITNFDQKDLTGGKDKQDQIAKYLPVVMTVEQARKAAIPIEIWYGSQMDKNRDTAVVKKEGKSLFGKRDAT